ncbi:MAG: MFS transporter, partial [Planctomycetota bacterium]
IMLVLRFMAGPIVHRLSPLGLLAVSAFLAICGLTFLSQTTGMTIFLAATIYGLGKTFFWPTMLGVVSERFPQGGALTLNLMGGIGMLAAGVLGNALLGNIQDKEINRQLLAADPELHKQLVGEEKISIFGRYDSLDAEKVKAATAEDIKVVDAIKERAKKGALTTVALFPGLMLLSYLGLLLYFRAKGGYKPVDLASGTP